MTQQLPTLLWIVIIAAIVFVLVFCFCRPFGQKASPQS